MSSYPPSYSFGSEALERLPSRLYRGWEQISIVRAIRLWVSTAIATLG